MLARAELPDRYREWNRQWGAPFGRLLPVGKPWRNLFPRAARPLPGVANLVGLFAFQPNSHTRTWEYPWMHETLALRPGMSVLEVGGGLSGFQFVLSREGCRVVNVDPGKKARGKGWVVTPERMASLNRRFGTDVELKNCFVEEAGLPDAAFDCAISISTIEHVPDDDVASILDHVRRSLKPGGRFLLTVDLFLDVTPFTECPSNRWGRNVDVRWMVEQSGLTLEHGDPSELHGFPAFDPGRILARKEARELLFDERLAPVMVPTLVLRKP